MVPFFRTQSQDCGGEGNLSLEIPCSFVQPLFFPRQMGRGKGECTHVYPCTLNQKQLVLPLPLQRSYNLSFQKDTVLNCLYLDLDYLLHRAERLLEKLLSFLINAGNWNSENSPPPPFI